MKTNRITFKKLSRKDLAEIAGGGDVLSGMEEGNGGTNNGGTNGNILSCATTSMCYPQIVVKCKCTDPPVR
ncbi:hypothetical protein ACKW6Q_11160 [Chryseobacterium kwangjuense]|uniref:Bacteriocin n=1 Tax=Chryseobacterium kwangjuense TaxID=267125 RepID=A0ABW9K3A1_9FLAO